jgi:hypothetical protein
MKLYSVEKLFFQQHYTKPSAIVRLGLYFLLLASFIQSNAQSQSFGYTGSVQTYTFTQNTCIKLKAWGAGGGSGGADAAGPGGTGGGGGNGGNGGSGIVIIRYPTQ